MAGDTEAGATPQQEPRPRGGQLGNRNAKKYGIYGQQLDPEEAALLPQLLKVKGMTDEIALLRLRIAAIVRRKAPDETLFEAFDLLNRLVATNERVTSDHW